MRKVKNSGIFPFFQKYFFSDELPQETRLLKTILLSGFFITLAALITGIATGAKFFVILIISAIPIFMILAMFVSWRMCRIYADEKRKADSTGKDLELRNRLLWMVKETSEILLTSETNDLEETLLGAMDLMGRCVDADRIYIWKIQVIDGKPRYVLQYKWITEYGKKDNLYIRTGYFDTDTIPQWEFYFSAGRYVNGPLSSLSEMEQNFFSQYGICSILAIPVFLHEKLWGFVNFDDCRRERTFSKDEVSIISSGSLFLANTIVRYNNKLIIETRIRQQKLMASISKSFISKEPMDKLINEALKEMGEFMGATRVLIAEMDKNNEGSRLAYTWFKSDKWRPKLAQPEFKENINAFFPKFIPETGFVTAVCCNDIINEYSGKYKIFSKADIKSFIWAPVYVDGIFWGLISVEDCERNQTWSESDIQLVGTVSSAIAGAVARDLIDKAKNAALEQAVQASKAKGNFLANMSHEIRTPMNAIIGMTSIGKKSEDLQKKDYAFEKIENASTHLLGVINDILDMSKIEANKLDLSPVTFNFENLLQKVVNVINFRIDERRQDFTVHIDKNIPRFLVGDDQRLAQVITNLLSNAVKFTPELGSIRLDTRLVFEEKELYTIQIDVSDSGIGISKEQQAKLFHSFEQAESGTSRKFGGTGLGLAISKRIIELMGGQIWVKSELNKGSTFAFTIQAKKGHAVHGSMLAPGVNIRNIRILAVDDSPEILEYFADIMSRLGIQCDTACGGEKALELIEKKGWYDFYFVDWSMPGMDGIQLTRKISELRSAKSGAGKSVVVMISSGDWNIFEKDAKDAGVDKFLGKPLFSSAIVDVINECLGDHSLKKARAESKQEEVDRFDGYTMLLAEDVDINREIVLTLLEPTAISIDCAENGSEAVNKFAAAPDKYHMIFMDVQMPEMDGYEATRKIRALEAEWNSTPNTLTFPSEIRRKAIPIVAMTANVFHEDVEKCLAAGMNDHVGKPLDLSDILEKLRKYLPVKPSR